MKSKLFQRVTSHPTMLRMMMKSAPAMDRLTHRLTGGRFTVSGSVMPVLVLEALGAKSGQPRTTPLQYVKHGDGYVVIGSNYGAAGHPAWSANLRKHPDATVTLAGRTFPVKAELLEGEERADAWRAALEQWPPYEKYVGVAQGREFRIFLLWPKEQPGE